MIAGGVALACSLSLAGVATYTGAGLLETRREARALHDMVDGYATDLQFARDAMLRQDYQRHGTQTLALALASGTMMVVGAV
ncbi:hypothetical protein OV203_04940 [Nannocystis sp. ILAH1]|uniref:hypothetical protein n=1 Tax=Nannocystis sp. ILAH1 TaxID=2996789 RepID=UPI00226F0887|nr:hypothetical protein [Nannocystis sp. ILAH1]MCY0986452.1 hypothetical protein [Nannocystis sp. ILAH1]